MSPTWRHVPLLLGWLVAFSWASVRARAQQWTPVPLPPEAGGASEIKGSAGNLYGVFWRYDGGWTSEGLWKRSWNDGDWQLAGFAENLPVSVEVSAVDDRTVFLNCYSGAQRLFVSHDDGESWIGKVGPPEPIEATGVDRQCPSVIYGTRQVWKVYASTDDGDSWALWDGGAGSNYWTDVTAAPLNAMGAYAMHDDSWGGTLLLQTTNGGVSWQPDSRFPSEMGDGPGLVTVSPAHPDAAFVLSWYRLVENVAGSWTPHSLPDGFTGGAIAIPHWAPETIYIAGTSQQGAAFYPAGFKTTDFGETWMDITVGLPLVDLSQGATSVSLDWHPTNGTLALAYEYPPMLFFLQEWVSSGVGSMDRARHAGITLAPNPSRGPVVIRLRAANDERSAPGNARSIEIVNVLGRRIQTLSVCRDARDPTLLGRWNGEMEAGVPARPGVYFVRVNGGGNARLLVVR